MQRGCDPLRVVQTPLVTTLRETASDIVCGFAEHTLPTNENFNTWRY